MGRRKRPSVDHNSKTHLSVEHWPFFFPIEDTLDLPVLFFDHLDSRYLLTAASMNEAAPQKWSFVMADGSVYEGEDNIETRTNPYGEIIYVLPYSGFTIPADKITAGTITADLRTLTGDTRRTMIV